MPAADLFVTLQFDKDQLAVGKDATDLREGLSATALDGDRLWLACDEGCRVERLTRSHADPDAFGSHAFFELHALLGLPADASEEADIEGMDVDDGYLWLVGSHSLKRKKAKSTDSPAEVAKRLASLSRDGNRHLLARIPMTNGGLARSDGPRSAARLAATGTSSALLDAIVRPDDPAKADRHLASFVPLPGKDNGFDIEGLAVRGTRAFVGLRGPVLREWCCVLECQLESDGERLRLAPLDDSARYRKHFLKLNGLGVRDLIALEEDLMILTGPSMGHDGPSEIWRWKGALRGSAPAEATLERRLVLPHREGVDRAEGFTVYDNGDATAVLVVFDTPAKERRVGDSGLRTDVFRLP